MSYKKVQLAVKDVDERELTKIHAIFQALLDSGGMLGVKNGKTILHFDPEGNFVGVELNYWPWRIRKNN